MDAGTHPSDFELAVFEQVKKFPGLSPASNETTGVLDGGPGGAAWAMPNVPHPTSILSAATKRCRVFIDPSFTVSSVSSVLTRGVFVSVDVKLRHHPERGMRKDVTMEQPPPHPSPGRLIVLLQAIVQGDPEREGVIRRHIHDVPKLQRERV
jgi:hypothetical protein